ncbi:hypothetical protein FACS189442_3060 [Spirochaetia bacterium]|nr:hypothetical protein FACS189442_3060 [Spirochaetia bacterium]
MVKLQNKNNSKIVLFDSLLFLLIIKNPRQNNTVTINTTGIIPGKFPHVNIVGAFMVRMPDVFVPAR